MSGTYSCLHKNKLVHGLLLLPSGSFIHLFGKYLLRSYHMPGIENQWTRQCSCSGKPGEMSLVCGWSELAALWEEWASVMPTLIPACPPSPSNLFSYITWFPKHKVSQSFLLPLLFQNVQSIYLDPFFLLPLAPETPFILQKQLLPPHVKIKSLLLTSSCSWMLWHEEHCVHYPGAPQQEVQPLGKTLK